MRFPILIIAVLSSISLGLKGQSSNQNYIHTTKLRVEVLTETQMNNLPDVSKQQSVIYYDGLGRPDQEILYRNSSNYEDIVKVYSYDQMGREASQYLPFADGASGLNYKNNALSTQANFYKNKARVAHSDFPWGTTVFESSPLGKVTERFAPGEGWYNSHSIQINYRLNLPNEVRFWQVNAGTGAVTSAQFYDEDELMVEETTDEHGYKTLKFLDKLNRVVLKSAQLSLSPVEYTQTYYIYDYQGLLHCVIPPEAYSQMSTYDVDAEIPERVYRYRYDHEKRLIEKKIPHKGWEYVVYDNLNRPVLSQDAGQRIRNEWSFTKYDKIGRPVIKGLLITTGTRSSMQSNLDNGLANFTYQNYENRSSASGSLHGYTQQAFPINGGIDYHIINYYDDYDFDRDGSPDVSAATPPNGFNVINPTLRTRSLPTGSLVQVLDGSGTTFLRSVSWYDERGRVIQSEAENHLGGIDRVFNQYNFIGELLRSYHHHDNGSQTHTIEKRFTYDHAGRLLKTYQDIDDQGEVILSELSYNALGQLTEKDLHGLPYPGGTIPPGWTQKYLQSVDYAYNIRGWLTHINNADLKDDAYNDASASTGGAISAFEFSSLSFKLTEVLDPEEQPLGLEIWVQDQSEMQVEGNLLTDHYENDEASRLWLMDYTEENPVYDDLRSIAGVAYSNTYSSARIVNASTTVGDLTNWIYPEVDAHLGETLTEEDALTLVQQAVFNYVSGKAGHLMHPDSVAFASAQLDLTYLEKNGHQLYLKIEGSDQEAEVFIMDKTTTNLNEYNQLLALTDDGGGGYNPLTVDFSTVSTSEGMGTVEVMEACQDYLATVLAQNNITNTVSAQALNRFGAAYAAYEFSNAFFNNDENDLWGLELKYNAKSTQFNDNDPLQSTPLYNGNIAEMHWKAAGDQVRRAYGYQYDGLNRITAATYKAFNYNNLLWDQEVNRYSLSAMSYDRNGNIQGLQRKGFTSGTVSSPGFGLMDNLSYTYSGDQLLAVSDAATHHINDFNDGNTSGNDYSYDANGNMTADLNKNINQITYNHLNLPKKITFNSHGGYIEYIYDANGNKLQKVVFQQQPYSVIVTTDYSAIGNYTDGNLDFIFTDEGRAVEDNGSWRYEYYYKDHLGNTCLGFSDYNEDEAVEVSEITQQHNYYPFGLEHKGTNYGVATQTTYKYLFQKQELQDELGLGWYSFRWRNSMPELGRFFNTDPLADEYVHNSVYAFSENRVTDGIELEGLEHLSIKRVAQTNGGFQTTITPQSNQELGDLHNSPLQIQYQNYDANNNLVSERTSDKFLYPHERQMVQERFKLHPHRNGFVDRDNPGRIGSIQFTTANPSSTSSASTSSTVTPVINFVPGRANLAPSTSPNIFRNLVGLAPNSTTSSTNGNITTTISSSSTIGISIRSTLRIAANANLFANRYNTLRSGLVAAGFPASNIINNGALGGQPIGFTLSGNQVLFNINTTTQTIISSTRQMLQNVSLIGNGSPDTY